MGTLQCQICKITSDAETKEEAIANIDHAANSKRCNGKDENCNWYSKGIPDVELNPVVDPKRPFQGVTAKTQLSSSVSTKKTKDDKKK